MRVHFIGDVHGHFDDLGRVLRVVPADVYIQVGDMGLAEEWLEPGEIPEKENFHYIRGNHDQYQFIKDCDDRRFVDDGESFDLGDSHLVFCGGGYSVDHRTRIEGLTWWRDEIPEKAVLDKFFSNIRTAMELKDNLVIVTHTPPVRVIKSMRPRSEKNEDTLAIDFDSALEHLIEDYPCTWVCGHLHPEAIIERRYKNTRLICLPPVHDFQLGGGRRWLPSAGITLEL